MIELKEYLTRSDMEELDNTLQFIPITFDYLFKSLFSSNLDILRKFILSQIDNELVPEECKITLLNSELPKENDKEYKKTVDLYVLVNNSIYVNIEVNKEKFEDVRLRNFMYESKLYSMILEKGENTEKLKEKCFVQINLNAGDKNSDIGEDTIVLYGLKTKQVYALNKYTLVKYLEYYRNLYYNENEKLTCDKMWLVSFTSRSFTELYDCLEYILTQEERERYLRKVIDLSKDVFILHEWEKEKLDELVRITAEENAIKRGLEQGLIQGIEQGIEQGIQEGIEKAKIETVKEMLKENLDIKLISKITKLKEEEIINIKANI